MRTDIGLELGGGRGARVSINSNTDQLKSYSIFNSLEMGRRNNSFTAKDRFFFQHNFKILFFKYSISLFFFIIV